VDARVVSFDTYFPGGFDPLSSSLFRHMQPSSREGAPLEPSDFSSLLAIRSSILTVTSSDVIKRTRALSTVSFFSVTKVSDSV